MGTFFLVLRFLTTVAFAISTQSFYRGLLLLVSNRLARTFTGPSVGLGALTANRETSPMPQTTIITEVDQTLDAQGDFAAQVTFDEDTLSVDHLTNRVDLFVAQIARFTVKI